MMRFVGVLAGLMLAFAELWASSSVDVSVDSLGEDRSVASNRLKSYLIAPKGEWQAGLSVMYSDFSSSNSEIMLLLQGMDAAASVLKIAPEALYTFKDNHALGVRFQYTNVSGLVDSMSADLLGNLTLGLENVNAEYGSMGGSIFQRTYVGLDDLGRLGIFWDYVLGYSRTKVQLFSGDPAASYTVNKKLSLSFAPGLVCFPMNNLSVQAFVSVAGLSYSGIRAYSDGQESGLRRAWKAYSNINFMDINIGLTIYL